MASFLFPQKAHQKGHGPGYHHGTPPPPPLWRAKATLPAAGGSPPPLHPLMPMAMREGSVQDAGGVAVRHQRHRVRRVRHRVLVLGVEGTSEMAIGGG